MCLHVRSPWRAESYFARSTFLLRLIQCLSGAWGCVCVLRRRLERSEVEHSAIVSLSLSAGPPGSFALRGGIGTWEGGGGGVWHKEVEVFLVSHLPEEKASCQKSAWAERQARWQFVGLNDAFFITQRWWWTLDALSSVGKKVAVQDFVLVFVESPEEEDSTAMLSEDDVCTCKSTWGLKLCTFLLARLQWESPGRVRLVFHVIKISTGRVAWWHIYMGIFSTLYAWRGCERTCVRSDACDSHLSVAQLPTSRRLLWKQSHKRKKRSIAKVIWCT